MLIYVVAFLYILGVVGVAYIGRRTPAGWGGTMILAILFTPVIVLLALILLGRRRPAH